MAPCEQRQSSKRDDPYISYTFIRIFEILLLQSEAVTLGNTFKRSRVGLTRFIQALHLAVLVHESELDGKGCTAGSEAEDGERDATCPVDGCIGRGEHVRREEVGAVYGGK
jgi:hypothetical protein